jgi:cytochrome bd ubiquinol oxidase subunit I
VTASFVVVSVSALWLLRGVHLPHARKAMTLGLGVGLVAAVLVAFPTGDTQAKLVAKYQPIALASMEGRFESGTYADITLIGQPNVPAKRLDNPIKVPGVLSFLAYGTFHSDVKGLDAFPPDEWPQNIEILYYAFHVMAGLGTIFIGLMALGNFLRLRGQLERRRSFLWVLFFVWPFPYIATTAGWMSAELGRQPWLVYGLLRTVDGSSLRVHSGDVLFTLFGFMALYLVMGLLFVVLVLRELARGPVEASHA